MRGKKQAFDRRERQGNSWGDIGGFSLLESSQREASRAGRSRCLSTVKTGGVAVRELQQSHVAVAIVRSFETAERDDERMAFKIRLERCDFPVVSGPKTIHIKWKRI